MSDTKELNGKIQYRDGDGIVLILTGSALRACTMKDNRNSILVKLLNKDSRIIKSWPGSETNNGYYKLELKKKVGEFSARLPVSVVNSILKSGLDSFMLNIKGAERELECECFKYGSISAEQALGKEYEDNLSYTETETHQSAASQGSAGGSEDTNGTKDRTAAKQDEFKGGIPPSGSPSNIKRYIIFAAIAAALLIAALIAMFIMNGSDSALKAHEDNAVAEQSTGDNTPAPDNGDMNAAQDDGGASAAQDDGGASAADPGNCSVAAGYDSSVIGKCARHGSRDEIIAFIKQAVSDNKCESAVNVLLYRARNEKSDPVFAYRLAEFYDSKSKLSLPCLKKDDNAAKYYYDIVKKMQNK